MSLRRMRTGGRSRGLRTLLLLTGLSVCLTAFHPADGFAKTKSSRAPRPEPELKILALNIAPVPYRPASGSLEFSLTVQLPKELDGATILEVSSLISSPSKTSLRFLSHRQSIQAPDRSATASGERPRLELQLSWDGQDHRKQLAGPGHYAYEVRIKLLADGEKGPRTMMVAWPKRGTLEVK